MSIGNTSKDDGNNKDSSLDHRETAVTSRIGSNHYTRPSAARNTNTFNLDNISEENNEK